MRWLQALPIPRTPNFPLSLPLSSACHAGYAEGVLVKTCKGIIPSLPATATLCLFSFQTGQAVFSDGKKEACSCNESSMVPQVQTTKQVRHASHPKVVYLLDKQKISMKMALFLIMQLVTI